jgi:lipocalin
VVFEIGSSCVNATYTANPNGTVSVFNQDINLFGKYANIRGIARVKDPAVPAAFLVTFDNG